MFNSPYGVNYSKGNISSGGTSAGNYNLGRIRAFQIPLPQLAEQNVIVEKTEILLSIVDDLENGIRLRKENINLLVKTVLNEAFN